MTVWGKGAPCVVAVAAALLANSILPTAAMAKDKTLKLQPSSPWRLDYSPDSCKLARVFGEGDEQIVLLLTRYSPDPYMAISLSGKKLRNLPNHGDYSLRFRDGAEPQENGFFAGDLADRPALIGQGGIYVRPLSEAEREALPDDLDGATRARDHALDLAEADKSQYVWVDIERKDPIQLNSGSLGKPYRAWDECLGSLVKSWGVDPERYAARTRDPKPIGNPGSWISSRDYPLYMEHIGGQAIVRFRLTIDAQGAVTDCHIQDATRGDDFQEVVCEKMRKLAKFEPALDADGQPMTGYYLNTVRFEMPT